MAAHKALGGKAFDIGWTAYATAGSNRETGDPLGIRTWANRIAPGLVPALSNVTMRVQGYGLLCAGLEIQKSNQLAGLTPVDVWHRFERLWVISQTAHAADGSDIYSWPGKTIANRMVTAKEADLTTPLLGREISAGTWGAYRRSSGLLGLITAKRGGRATSPADTRLTGRGDSVGAAWRETNLASSSTTRPIARVLSRRSCTVSEAMDLFVPDVPRDTPVAAALTHAIEGRFDSSSGLQALRKVWDRYGTLEPGKLIEAAALLDSRQRLLAPQAESVLDLFRLVEKPYRRYVTRGTGAAPSARAWNSKSWGVAVTYSDEARELRNAGLSTSGSWDGVQSWAQRLAGSRGGSAPEPGRAPVGYDRTPAPAMSLLAAASLFGQGLLGRALDLEVANKSIGAAHAAVGTGGARDE